MRWVMLGLFLMGRAASTAAAESTLPTKFRGPNIELVKGFPVLAKLLALENPWTNSPADFVNKLFPPQTKLVQGSQTNPLLYVAQRSRDWPGLPIWNQVAYETEFYVFDPARPVIRFHIGRPLDAGLQLTDYSLSEETKAFFPPLNDSVRKEIADNVRKLIESLRPLGAQELPF